LYITVFLAMVAAPAASARSQGTADPDALYAGRSHLQIARQAADIWANRLARTPQDFESAWKLARARYWLGGHASGDQIRVEFEAGAAAARQAAQLRPQRPEGHFWLAANLGGLAETQGRLTGLRLRKEIKSELERVLTIDAAFQDGSADRALGRWYMKVPRLFGGSRTKAEIHLRRSLRYNSESTASLFFLAELLVDDDRTAEAAEVLRRVENAPINPAWEAEDREFKAKAARLLETVRP
jgi:hypothetical protein